MRIPYDEHLRLRAAELRLHIPSRSVPKPSRGRTNLIVSLTSYPARIAGAWLAVEAILRQSLPPNRVVLALSETQFPKRELPFRLVNLQDRGLEILWTPRDLGSYKKLLPILAVAPQAVIVTADDDTLYPRRWLAQLVSVARTAPGSIIAHRARRMELIAERSAAPYASWPRATTSTPPRLLFPTGMGGVLYPPGSLLAEALDYDLASRLAPTADDVWFKAMSLLAGSDSRVVTSLGRDFPAIRASQSVALFHGNVGRNANDPQIAAVLDHFDLWHRLRHSTASQ